MSALVKISEQNITTPAADLTYTGFTTDYNIYYLTVSKIRTTQVNGYMKARLTENNPSPGTPITTSNYYLGGFGQHSGFASPFNWANNGATEWSISYISQNNNGEGYYYEMWIYNPADASLPTTIVYTSVGNTNSAASGGLYAGAKLLQNVAVDGIQFFPTGGGGYSIAEAEFKLYGLKEN